MREGAGGPTGHKSCVCGVGVAGVWEGMALSWKAESAGERGSQTWEAESAKVLRVSWVLIVPGGLREEKL